MITRGDSHLKVWVENVHRNWFENKKFEKGIAAYNVYKNLTGIPIFSRADPESIQNVCEIIMRVLLPAYDVSVLLPAYDALIDAVRSMRDSITMSVYASKNIVYWERSQSAGIQKPFSVAWTIDFRTMNARDLHRLALTIILSISNLPVQAPRVLRIANFSRFLYSICGKKNQFTFCERKIEEINNQRAALQSESGFVAAEDLQKKRDIVILSHLECEINLVMSKNQPDLI